MLIYSHKACVRIYRIRYANWTQLKSEIGAEACLRLAKKVKFFYKCFDYAFDNILVEKPVINLEIKNPLKQVWSQDVEIDINPQSIVTRKEANIDSESVNKSTEEVVSIADKVNNQINEVNITGRDTAKKSI